MNHLYRVLFLSFLFGVAQASERQFDLSAYMDTNPMEQISNPETSLGIKAKGQFQFSGEKDNTQYFGTVLGQGFLEPSSFSRTKFIVNADAGAVYRMSSNLTLTALAKTFQKRYLLDHSRSGRSSAKLFLDIKNKGLLHKKIGISTGKTQLDYGTPLEFTDRKVSFAVNRFLTSKIFAETSFTWGQSNFQDYSVKVFSGERLITDVGKNQQDEIKQLVLHCKYTGLFIGGVMVSFEDIQSNSVVAEARVLTGKLYASGRLGDRLFFHFVLQGMDKKYAYPEVFFQNLYRDPEESIQNQIHLQIERILTPNRVLFVQFSYLKNETVFDRWYYEKTILETGLKITL